MNGPLAQNASNTPSELGVSRAAWLGQVVVSPLVPYPYQLIYECFEFSWVIPRYFPVFIPLDSNVMSLFLSLTSIFSSRFVPSISGILKAHHWHPLRLLSVLRDMLPGVTTLNFSSRSQRRAAFFVRLGLGFCRRSKRDALLEDRWLPLDGAGCDRLQVDACCFKVGWFGRAGLCLVAILCHGLPIWCSDHHPLICGLARWARRRP